MIEIFYHVNLFSIGQVLTVRYPNGNEEYIDSTMQDIAEYLADYVIDSNKQYKIYLSGLSENNLIPIKEQILQEIAAYHSSEYAGVEVEII